MIEDFMALKVVKHVKIEYLDAFFKTCDVKLPETWRDFTPRNLKPFIEAVQTLPDETSRVLGQYLVVLASVGGDSKNVAMIRSALNDWGIAPPEGVEAMNAPNLAAWALAHIGLEQRRGLLRRAEVNARPLGEWRFYNLKFNEAPTENAVAERRGEIEQAISKSVVEKEFRGHGHDSECYAVRDDDGNVTEYMMMRLTDHPGSGAVWWAADEEKFVQLNGPGAFPIVFMFDHAGRRLGVLSEGSSRERCDGLCKAFAKAAFGETCTRAEPVKYDLAPLRERSDLPSAEELGIKAAKVVGVELWLDGSRDRKRKYYEKRRDIQKTIAAELPREVFTRESTLVKRVWIRIVHETPRNPQTEKEFIVSEGSIGGMSDPMHGLGKNFKGYLRNVLKVVVVEDDDQH